MTDPRLEGLRRLRDSLELFSVHCLKIADKEGKTTPFAWNRAQQYVHERLEEQEAKTGKVEYRVDKQAIVRGGSARIAAFAGQQRFDPLKLIIPQPKTYHPDFRPKVRI